ncbi:permease, partial [Glycomyces tenuis]
MARFVAVMVQAVPFLTLGVVLSSAIAAFVPAGFFHRVLPGRPALAVPVAGACGAVLPGCECASVPVAGALVRRGVAPAAALTFMLASPAINPIVLVSTFVAFPGQPEMVWARLTASLGAAVAIGWLWIRLGRTEWLR